ncbi:uncharacterized protein LOC134824953 [Bolinopsis microptera]|uniref:uncharacterized protein LOC134824953 n=1 Tax=Bolinopsis microptera TaxID=2820187 RepID=UPI00307A705A
MKLLLVLSVLIMICASLSVPLGDGLEYLDEREDSTEEQRYGNEDASEEVDPSEEMDDDVEPATCTTDRCVQDTGRAMWLETGQTIESSKIRAFMQTDGNLVVYCKSWCPCARKPVWASNTSSTLIDTGLKIEKDGDLVLYDTKGDAVWQSGTHVRGGKFTLVAQEDSNLVLYSEKGGEKTQIWDSGTKGRCYFGP